MRYRLCLLLIALALLVVAAVGCGGFYANAWAAWAPPGEANSDYGRLVFASRFYGVLAILCLAAIVAIAVSLLRISDKP